MSKRYIFDGDDIRFRKSKTSVWAVIRRILMFCVAYLSLSVLYDVILAIIRRTGCMQRSIRSWRERSRCFRMW